jgi:hypothetical protein
MQARVLDLDGSAWAQPRLIEQVGTRPLALRDWGPSIRLACTWRGFHCFEKALASECQSASDVGPWLTFCGSGDFHHVSLALLRRLRTPCNLLVLDKHPDWMVGLPFLHCGTWVLHAAALPQVGCVYHVGGDLDFDNAYRWLAPWRRLRRGSIRVIPAIRSFPWRAELAARPLYVSLDKDVLSQAEAPANWDSGWLSSREVFAVIDAFASACGQRLAGMDVVGDWSEVRVRGLWRRGLHWAEHPALQINPQTSGALHERLNLAVLRAAGDWTGASGPVPLAV